MIGPAHASRSSRAAHLPLPRSAPALLLALLLVSATPLRAADDAVLLRPVEAIPAAVRPLTDAIAPFDVKRVPVVLAIGRALALRPGDRYALELPEPLGTLTLTLERIDQHAPGMISLTGRGQDAGVRREVLMVLTIGPTRQYGTIRVGRELLQVQLVAGDGYLLQPGARAPDRG